MITRFILDELSPPYLVVRVVPRMFHVTVLPAGMAQEELAAIARAQVAANRLDAFLVSEQGTRYFLTEAPPEDGTPTASFSLLNHRTAQPVCDRLPASVALTATEELAEREALLTRLVEEYQGKRETFLRERGLPLPAPFVFGDFTKGGHEPSVEELLALTGRQPSGVPIGLERCSVCSDWRGECIDEIKLVGTRVVPVHCRCDNENCCARCGEAFGERRLNGNYYEDSTDSIWHVPALKALEHACRTERDSAPQPSVPEQLQESPQAHEPASSEAPSGPTTASARPPLSCFHDVLRYVDHSAMTLCLRCYEPRGLWSWLPGRDNRSNLPPMLQHCSCEKVDRRRIKSVQEGSWPGFDFNQVVALCHGCGADLFLSGSKWSVHFCSVCYVRVRRLNVQVGRLLVPLGRHSLMNGIGLDPLDPDEEAVVGKFLQEANTMFSGLDTLELWKNEVTRRHAAAAGLDESSHPTLAAFLAMAEQRVGDRMEVFADMVEWYAAGAGR